MASPALVAAALAVLAPAGPETPLVTATRVSKDYANALRTKNIGWFDKHTGADYVYVTRKGERHGRTQTLKQLRSVLASDGTTFQKVEVKVLSARKTEGGILSLTDTVVIAHLKAPDGHTAKLEAASREESLWVPRGKEWIAKRVKELKDSTKIDGKPMPG